ncbi:hypothetical protein CC80DRAFT_413117, partial [Byssothecium circinans]
NGSALGIMSDVVPSPGKNSVTEIDTTVFGKTNIATNSLGKINAGGSNKVADVAGTMAQSGSMVPQVNDGGLISGTFHIIATDAAGLVSAMIDSCGAKANVVTNKTLLSSTSSLADTETNSSIIDAPGNKGNVKPSGVDPRGIEYWALRARSLVARAPNVNMKLHVHIAVPVLTTCSANVCFMKIANSNRVGPFGGVIAFQMAGAFAATGNTTAAVVGNAGSTTSTAGTQNGATTGAGATTGPGLTTETGATPGIKAARLTKTAKGAARRFVA